MPAMNSTERIFLRLERPGYPFDIAEIILLEVLAGGSAAVRAGARALRPARHRSPPLTRVVAPAPLGIGEERWTPAASLDIDQHVHQMAIPAPGDMPRAAGHGHRGVRRSRSTAPTAVGGVVSDRDGRRHRGAGAAHPPRDGRRHRHLQLHRPPVRHRAHPGGREPATAAIAGPGRSLPAAPSPVRDTRSNRDRGGHDRTDLSAGSGAAVPQAVVRIPTRAVREPAPSWGRCWSQPAGPRAGSPAAAARVHPLTHRSPTGDPVQQACGQPAQGAGGHLRAVGRGQAGAAPRSRTSPSTTSCWPW